ncbi:MAG: HXXEE domain-containing protein [Pseudomonadota bacterium]
MSAMAWLDQHWVWGAAGGAPVLLIAILVFLGELVPAQIAAALCLPVYMAHQVEEHLGGRFKHFVNEAFGDGNALLTDRAILVINVPLVWGLTLGGFLLSLFVAPYWGLLGIYALVVNAPAHIGQAVLLRRYNPGLATAVALFLPVGIWGLVQNADAPVAAHLACLAISIGLHALIVAHLFVRRSAFRTIV